jgi:GNAT superfamily N-acetyltransferase
MSHPRSPVPIRAAVASDAPSLARLLVELGYPADPAEMPGRLTRMCADGAAAAFVADGDDGAVGLVTVSQRVVLHSATPICQLTALVVREDVRGRGVGAALVATVEDWARERGATRIVVTTALHRAEAPLFYERLGYEHTGRRYVHVL